MKTVEQKMIMYDSPEAATYKTDIEGWVSSDGIYCGKGKQGENAARYRSATHRKCEHCDNIVKTHSYTSCESCRSKKIVENYLKKPYKEYDGSLVVISNDDKYFPDEDAIIDYLEENELESVDLLFCEENNFNQIDSDYWADIMPEDSDGELPKALQEALDNLNNVIKGLPPCSYSPGGFRTTYRLKQ